MRQNLKYYVFALAKRYGNYRLVFRTQVFHKADAKLRETEINNRPFLNVNKLDSIIFVDNLDYPLNRKYCGRVRIACLSE
ncbi:hypothetical protein BMR04_09895 [Methylococcaceae bacterium HT3]|nr:hypothetical protein BMR04_09895 [Methylococcaceae bacterium HT3]